MTSEKNWMFFELRVSLEELGRGGGARYELSLRQII